jgi:hypothetical protein
MNVTPQTLAERADVRNERRLDSLERRGCTCHWRHSGGKLAAPDPLACPLHLPTVTLADVASPDGLLGDAEGAK